MIERTKMSNLCYLVESQTGTRQSPERTADAVFDTLPKAQQYAKKILTRSHRLADMHCVLVRTVKLNTPSYKGKVVWSMTWDDLNF
jgi:hypothetical protein